MVYLGDAANNMANSYLLGGATAGMLVNLVDVLTGKRTDGPEGLTQP